MPATKGRGKKKNRKRGPSDWAVVFGAEDRAALFDELSANTPLVGVRSGENLFVVSTQDAKIGRSLFSEGRRNDMSMLSKALSLLLKHGEPRRMAGTTFLDIGANIGTTCIHAVTEQGFDRAVAIEPVPENRRLLKANVALNDLEDRFRILPFAVSDEAGTARMIRPEGNSGGARIVDDPAESSDLEYNVEQTTIDELVGRGVLSPAEIGLIWIDAEGHEGHILGGAQSLTREHVPIVLEFAPRLLGKAGGVERLAAAVERNYTTCMRLHGGSGRRMPVSALRQLAEEEGIRTDLLIF